MGEFYGQKKKPRLADPTVLYQVVKAEDQYGDYYEDFAKHLPFEEANHAMAWDRGTNIEIHHDLPMEVENLRTLVRILYLKLERIENHFPEFTEVSAPIEEKVPIKEAKLMVQTFLKTYFRKEKEVYPSDVADALGLSYETVRKTFDILEKEGKLRVSVTCQNLS
jgi:hypothetical protein